MSAEPAVSVVVPTYNQPALLLETLQSVFAQTFTDFEVILVDDGSTDDTPARLVELAAREPRLRVVRQVNAGTGAARNRGIDEARGKYIALLDHDDLWMPGKLAAQVAFLERHPECVACIVPYAQSDAVDRLIFDPAAVAGADGIIDRPLRKLADRVPLLTTCSVLMFRRESASGLRFGTDRESVEDVQFEIGLLGRGKFGVAGGQMLAIYRIHTTNASRGNSYYYNGIKLLRRMDRQGSFAHLSADDRRDMLAWLGFVGRAALVSQLLYRQRLRGWELYFREFFHQARQRHLAVLLGFPALAMMPSRWAWAWCQRKGSRQTSDEPIKQ